LLRILNGGKEKPKEVRGGEKRLRKKKGVVKEEKGVHKKVVRGRKTKKRGSPEDGEKKEACLKRGEFFPGEDRGKGKRGKGARLEGRGKRLP